MLVFIVKECPEVLDLTITVPQKKMKLQKPEEEETVANQEEEEEALALANPEEKRPEQSNFGIVFIRLLFIKC